MDKTSSPRQLGLITVISLVAGGMIGSGIFTLPSALAQFGGISILGWIVAAVGAMILAHIMGRLSKVIPESGGSYAYTKRAFGDFPAFFVAWGFWLSLWSTNVAIALTFTGYLSVFFPEISQSNYLSPLISLFVIWILTIINSRSIRTGGNLQVLTTALKVIPVLVVAIGGIFFFNPEHFSPFNLSGTSSAQAVLGASVLCFYAFLGIEAATIPADNIKNPEKNISKGTLIGVGLVVFLYMFSSISLFGVLPPGEVAVSLAPLSDAATKIFGGNANYFVAIGACISTFGALNGWILIQGQIAQSMAKDGLLPKILAYKNKNNSPSTGIIVSSVFVTILLILNMTKGFASLYSFMVLLSTITSLFFYLSAALVYTYFSFHERLGFSWNFKSKIISLLGLGFSVWVFFGSGIEAIIWGLGGMLLGAPVYFYNKKQRK
ncbi:amino acid permease [Algoriphagus sp.]|uniref:APC family permease n=1 Tax=Algoriphagus sp. TaxID=1872435 RepID=UPI0025DC3252|nr:amino acid permease [Algoriphagus sp.]